MKRKRSSLSNDYNLQVWWKPEWIGHSRNFHVLDEIRNFENSEEWVTHQDERQRIRTVGDYLHEVAAKELKISGLAYSPRELEKIQTVVLNNERDEPIKALVLKLNKSQKWVIALHGWGENMYSALHQTYLLAQSGFNVLTFDSKGHGQSYGEIGDFGYRSYKDVARIINYLKRFHKMNHYALLGWGSGASTVLRYAQKIGHQDLDLKFLICDSGFGTLKELLRSYCESRYKTTWGKISRLAYPKFHELLGFDLKKYDLTRAQAMRQIARIPILFIHGERDQLIGVKHISRLHRQKSAFEHPPRSQLLIVPNSAHKECLHKGGSHYVKGVMAFLKSIKEIA